MTRGLDSCTESALFFHQNVGCRWYLNLFYRAEGYPSVKRSESPSSPTPRPRERETEPFGRRQCTNLPNDSRSKSSECHAQRMRLFFSLVHFSGTQFLFQPQGEKKMQNWAWPRRNLLTVALYCRCFLCSFLNKVYSRKSILN